MDLGALARLCVRRGVACVSANAERAFYFTITEPCRVCVFGNYECRFSWDWHGRCAICATGAWAAWGDGRCAMVDGTESASSPRAPRGAATLGATVERPSVWALYLHVKALSSRTGAAFSGHPRSAGVGPAGTIPPGLSGNKSE